MKSAKLFLYIGFCALFVGMSECFGQLDQIGTYNRFIIEKWEGQFYQVGPFRVKGSPYLFGKSYPGRITYAGQSLAKNGTVLYDIHAQKVGPELNGQIFEMNSQVTDFDLFNKEGDKTDTMHFVIGSGFGEKGKQQYYQVLGGGENVSFLKTFRLKVVADPSNMMDKDLKIFQMYDEHFVYTKAGGIKKVRLNEKDIMKALAAFPGASDLAGKMSTKFNEEASTSSFFNSLNNQ